ncbi:MAG: ribonuclease III [Patescibacteria group bacterium]
MLKKLLKINKIEKIFNIKINDPTIWLEAVIHKSWLFYYHRSDLPNNERLEFLGDSVLQMITSHYLYENYKNLNEGELSLLRASLVNRNRLGEIAQKLKILEILNISPVLDKKGLITVLGDSLEALIGALFLDQGLEKTKEFIIKNILFDIDKVLNEQKIKDPKTTLQEIVQKKYGITPHYETEEISGPPHKRNFKVGLYLEDLKMSEGWGSSKQEAEFDAALKFLEKIKEENNL